MENNQQQAQQTPQPVQGDPVPQVTPVQPELGSDGSLKKILIIVLILLVLIAVAGGLVYFRNKQQLLVTEQTQTLISAFDDLKKDLESLDIGASESDLSEIDQDLQNL